MTLSVAMCTYNGAAFLREQLDSIAAQTRLPEEMVVCDDCSADETAAILAAFAARAPFPVRVYHNPVNLGSTKNFEQVVSLCRSDIIALSDQDDVWLPEKLAKLEQPFANSAVGLVFTDADLVDDRLRPLGLRLWEAYFPLKAQRQMQAGKAFKVQLDRNVVTGATMAFRSELRKIALPIPDNIHLIHDGWIALVAAAVSELVFLPEPLILYRQHPNQQVGIAMRPHKQQHSALPRQHYTDHLLQLEEIERRLVEASEHHSDHNLRSNVQKSLLHLQHIQSHARHLRVRLKMPGFWLVRVFFVTTQLFTGRYHRYSNGVRSAIRDFWFPLDAQEIPGTQSKNIRTND